MRERLIFDYTMESLVRTLGPPTPEYLSALATLGIEVDKPLLPAYPIETFVTVVDYVAKQRWPRLSPEAGSFEVGRAFMEGYTQTLMGRALKSVMRTVGPHRVLERMSRNFRTANNYTQTRLVQRGPSSYELWCNYVVSSGFYRGLLQAGLELAGAREPEVRLLDWADPEATFTISWK
ncbi:DUF2378 family protein [Myxococcaceae bacterium GXIMD 01537]